jgi:hypothetical protein
MDLERRRVPFQAVTICTAGHAHVRDVVLELLVLHPDTRPPFVLEPGFPAVYQSPN